MARIRGSWGGVRSGQNVCVVVVRQHLFATFLQPLFEHFWGPSWVGESIWTLKKEGSRSGFAIKSDPKTGPPFVSLFKLGSQAAPSAPPAPRVYTSYFFKKFQETIHLAQQMIFCRKLLIVLLESHSAASNRSVSCTKCSKNQVISFKLTVLISVKHYVFPYIAKTVQSMHA